MARLEPFRSPQGRARLLEMCDAVMDTWPVVFEQRDVLTSFGKTNVVVSGADSAPPLILLHGAATTAAGSLPVITELSGRIAAALCRTPAVC